MARLTLRKGFTLQPAPGGMGHLTDSRTGDVLVVPPADYALLSSGDGDGLNTDRGDISEVLNRYRPFYVEATQGPAFYELDIEDAPTVPQIPSVAPVTMAEPPPDEAETRDDVPLAELMPLPEPDALTQPEGNAAVAAASADDETIQEAPLPEATRLSAPEPAPPPQSAPNGKPSPLLLAFAGLLVLGLGVGATFLLRPELFAPEGPTQPNPTTVVPPPKPEPLGVEEVDAGAEEEIDAGGEELDAGATAVAEVEDAGPPAPLPREEEEESWLTSEVQARGRVKMGEVIASASGVVSWTVQEEERVKTKQSLGSIARENGSESPLTSPSVGLAMLKQPSGATVKRGELLADIIYFEAWAKGLVKGPRPTTSWRCELESASAKQKADCKISVITPRSGGWQLMVAVEPRWFDEASDAVLRVAPP